MRFLVVSCRLITLLFFVASTLPYVGADHCSGPSVTFLLSLVARRPFAMALALNHQCFDPQAYSQCGTFI